jgi:hypothetical protein
MLKSTAILLSAVVSSFLIKFKTINVCKVAKKRFIVLYVVTSNGENKTNPEQLVGKFLRYNTVLTFPWKVWENQVKSQIFQ